MPAAQVEGPPFTPGIHPLMEMDRKVLAEVTGGTLTGDHLSFYGDSFFIDYPGARLDFAIEHPGDEGTVPALLIADSSIGLMSASVITDPNRARIVRAADAIQDTLHLSVVTIQDAKVAFSITPSTTIDEIKRLDDPRITEAALLSWIADRRVLEDERRTHYDFVMDQSHRGWGPSDREKAERELNEAETSRQAAQAILDNWKQEQQPQQV